MSGLSARYGPVHALRDVSLEVRAAELVALIGANGAGKSTLLRAIAGLVAPVAGRVALDGRDVTGQAPEAMIRAGVALVPERRRVFAPLTVLDNLELGGYALPRGREFRSRLEAGVEEAYRLFPVLRRRRDQLAGTLSGGEQQMLAIGRALMTRPRLLLCDEPSLGLAPSSWRRSCGSSRRSARPARRSCSSSRMRAWRSGPRTGPTSSRSAAWCSPARRRIFSRTTN